MKRYLCLTLGIFMLLSCLPRIAGASFDAELSAKGDTDFVITDFSSGQGDWKNSDANYPYLNTVSDFDFTNGKTVAYFKPVANSDGTLGDKQALYAFETTDFSAYSGFYMWIYAPKKVDKQFVICFVDADNSPSDGKWQCFYKMVTIDFSGWKLLYIPFDGMTKNRTPSWSNINRIQIQQNGFSTDESIDCEYYISKMWFSADNSSDAMTLESASVTDGSAGVKSADSLSFEFSKAPIINEITGVSLTHGNEKVNASYEINGKALTVTPESGFIKGGEYQLEIADIYSSAGIKADGIALSFSVNGDVIDEINSAGSAEELAGIINEYQAVIGLESADYSDLDTYGDVMEHVFETLPYSSLAALKAKISEYALVASELEALSQNSISEFVSERKDFLFGTDTQAYDKYISFDEARREIADSMIIKFAPFTLYTDFVTSFKDVVESFDDSEDESVSNDDYVIADFTKDIGTWKNSDSKNQLLALGTTSFSNGYTLGCYEVIGEVDRWAYTDLTQKDLSGYSGMYMWVYNPEKIDGASFVVYAVDADVSAEDGKWQAYWMPVSLDFEGWKLVYIPFDEMNLKRQASWNNIGSIRIQQRGDSCFAPDGTKFYFSKIWLSKDADSSEMVIVDRSVSDGESDVNINSVLSFEFSKAVMLNPIGGISLVNSLTGEEADIVCEADGTTLNITPESRLDGGAAYTLTLDGIYSAGGIGFESETVSFTASDSDFIVNAPVFNRTSLEKGGLVAAICNAVNNSAEDKSITFVIAAYNANGIMTDCSFDEYTISAMSSETVTVQIKLENADGMTVKAFALLADKLNQPVQGAWAALKNSSAPGEPSFEGFEADTGYPNGSFALVSAEADREGISLKASVKDGGKTDVAITLYSPDGKVYYTNVVSSDSNGCLAFKIPIDSANAIGGKYKLSLSAYRMTNSQPETAELYFADDALRKKIADEISSAKSAEKIASLLNTYAEALYIEETDYTDSKNEYISDAIFRNVDSSTGYDGICEIYADAVYALTEINTGSWTSYDGIVKEYTDIIFKNKSVYNSYKSLSETKRNMVMQNVAESAPFDSFGEFEAKVEDETDDIKDSGSGSGSGGSGGSGGKSSTGGFGVTTPANVPASVPQVTNEYTDITEEWAKPYIYELLNAGVLTMSSDRTFRPNDSITREEFVKMLVLALDIELTAGEGFVDVSESDWYYPYVCAAFNAGIVNGISSTEFGTGTNISREQMAAMAYRAKENLTLIKEPDLFTDDESISDYAKEAVYTMQSLGIINGMGDGSFAPHATATRAQAAKIIALLMKL